MNLKQALFTTASQNQLCSDNSELNMQLNSFPPELKSLNMFSVLALQWILKFCFCVQSSKQSCTSLCKNHANEIQTSKSFPTGSGLLTVPHTDSTAGEAAFCTLLKAG